MSLAATVCKGWADGNKATFLLCGVKRPNVGRIYFSFRTLICAKQFCLHCVFLLRFVWILNSLPRNL